MAATSPTFRPLDRSDGVAAIIAAVSSRRRGPLLTRRRGGRRRRRRRHRHRRGRCHRHSTMRNAKREREESQLPRYGCVDASLETTTDIRRGHAKFREMARADDEVGIRVPTAPI